MRKDITWSAGLVAAGLIAGGVLASTLSASADTAQTPSPSTTTRNGAAPYRAAHGGQRPDETPLTGTNAAKVKAAALKALPGATVDRVETDADGGGVYEAHVTKADGSRATVLFDKDFNVKSVEDGMGKGPGAPGTSGTSGA